LFIKINENLIIKSKLFYATRRMDGPEIKLRIIADNKFYQALGYALKKGYIIQALKIYTKKL